MSQQNDFKGSPAGPTCPLRLWMGKGIRTWTSMGGFIRRPL